jgi:transcriptional regulator with XRE-family HTH domain
MAHSTDVGQRIKELREARGMPKAELARRAGTTRNTLYRIESGRTSPSSPMIEQIAHGLGVVPGDLYTKGSAPLPDFDVRGRLDEKQLEADSPKDRQHWERVLESVRERQDDVEAKVEELVARPNEADRDQVEWALDKARDCRDTLMLALPGSHRPRGRGRDKITIDNLLAVDPDQWEECGNAERFYDDVVKRFVKVGLVEWRERSGQKAEPVLVGAGA